MLVSIIIRTFNEEKYLDELLNSIKNQRMEEDQVEIIVVDSGSTDRSVKIAKKYNCNVVPIKKKDFTFGRSLNIGCNIAKGKFLVFVSGHCIPASEDWLGNLIAPLQEEVASYTYGKQVGRDSTKFSEICLFQKYFPDYSKIPQEGFYCNNANAAIKKSVWKKYLFDEDLTGLEDMYLAKKILEDGYKVAYVAEAPVYHIHNESWKQIKIRYEREAYALQKILPEVHLNLFDVIKYFYAGVISDLYSAKENGLLMRSLIEIFLFRFMQYWGAYSGNHEHRQLSSNLKYKYFYPKDIEKHIYEKRENNSLIADEGK